MYREDPSESPGGRSLRRGAFRLLSARARATCKTDTMVRKVGEEFGKLDIYASNAPSGPASCAPARPSPQPPQLPPAPSASSATPPQRGF